MHKNYLLVCAILLSFMTSIYAQNNQLSNKIATKQFGRSIAPTQELTPSGHVRCYSTEYEASLKNKFPDRATTTEFETWLAPKIAQIKADRAAGRNIQAVYNIPVVIHIIHNGDAIGTGENITDAQAISQINVMNQDYRRMSGTRGGANSTGVAVDTQINFCLAQTDPNGNPTNGINRVNLNTVSFDNAAVESAKASTIWNPDNYLNMWTFRFSGDLAGVLGYAQFPSNSGLGGLATNGGAANTDGVVASFDAMGTIDENDGTFILNSSYNLGRTMTHEVGHWLGLRHIWGDGGCTVDDFCADTPLAASANYDCNYVDSCTAAGADQYQNYMDYSYDYCMDTFTADQKTRIQAVMQNSPRRNTLNASTACQAPAPYIQFGNPTGSINENTNCNFTDYTFPVTILKAATANAIVTFNVTGGTATQNVDYAIVNPTVTFPTGSTTAQNLTVRVFHDGIVEPNETIIVDLTLNASGGNALLNSGSKTITITIVDNDFAPIPTQVVSVLTEDFEDLTGWLILDGDTDGNNWGSVGGSAIDGLGTAPNTLSGRAAYSEKRLNYLSTGNGNTTPNNYLISPQFTIPAGASAVSLSYIIGGYDNGAQTRNAGDFSVYFTTSIASEATILAGTLVQTNLVVNEGTTQLRTNNLLALAGQTGYLVFRHNNTSNTNVGLLLLDTVNLNATVATNVQTAVNTPTLYQALIPTSGTVYAKDSSSGYIMTGIINAGTFNYGCTSVSVNRSNASAGAATSTFIDSNTANKILSKTFNITSANDTPTGSYTVKLYFTEAEVAAWESATGKTRSQLNIIKVQNNNISVVNSSNYTSYVIEEKPVTITSFGTNVVFEASFTTRISGGYAVGPKTGINCGDISSTWNGSSWSNGTPSKVTAVTFAGNFSSSSDIEACSVVVNTGVNVTFNSGNTLIVNGAVTVNGTGLLSIENNAGLRQIDDSAVNSGNIIVKRTATPTIRLDYTAWSSPVTGQQLQAFSPNTVSTRFYQYLYTGTTTPTAYQSVTATTNFLAGKGYMIRAADNASSTVASAYNGQFTGVPNNGIINQNMGQGFNLLGNPYASPISANSFLTANSSVGTLYFWTNTTAASGGVYPQNNFAAYTSGTGGVAAFASGKVPNGTIQTGQGFYLRKTTAGTTNAIFNNAQRVNASVSTQFYRNAETTSVETEKHRIWLNLNDNSNAYNQILVGYVEGATNGAENNFDGLSLESSSSSIYSIINDDKYVIQGKTLPFTDEDIVPLGLNAITAGLYNISLETIDGLFTTQDVFLKDKYTNITHNIKQSAYQFSTQDGIFDDRFELVYRAGVLSNDDFTNDNDVLVYTQNNQIEVNSLKENIATVRVFDVLGRNIFTAENVGEKELSISSINTNKQALFIKVTLTTGEVITKKVIF
ncbi:T9SS sorting signal type C domain-containing protein [Flavobacterium sp. N2270]|uniref:T9SS sorting signal type C domain-containing protein n=1 Tax=Flavobacterium sp. N2270 TaxID=2986831 RepID=UPI0022241973|nr:T9SS sorting signal type C domain-containing protein [Flavobacterium sp. N2270]